MPNKISQIWQELKRRNVVRVVTVYAGAAFIILELVDIIAEPLKLPSWLLPVAIVLLSIGFIIAIILSWIYDIHPEEGMVKTEPLDKVKGEQEPKSSNSWKIASYISFVVIVGLIVLNILGSNGRAGIDESLAKSIAVLPFHNLSGDDEQEYICVGLTDEIISNLFKVASFDEVRSLTSVIPFQDSEKSIKEIAQQLQVNYVLEGSYKRMGEDMKITAQLIEPAHDNHIWLRDYELPYSEVPGIPGEIARQIADHLKIFLTDNELKNIETKPTENIEAFNLYMQGRYFLSQSGIASLDKSITYYNEALSIDPNYALAYSGKAATFIAYATKGYSPRKDVLPLAKQAAMKAIELDSELGEAHAVLAQARVVQDWDWIRGEKGFQRALELNPNNVSAYFYYSWLLTDLERHDEAILKSKRAHELDPLSADVWVNYARRYYFARQFKRAIEEFHKIIDVFPENAYARIELALALAQNGNYIEALEECKKLELLPQPSWKIGVIYGIIGEEEKANEILDYYLERSENEFVWHASIFFIYAALNNKDAAFEWIEKTYEEREAWLALLQAEPMYDNLRSDPRFQDLVERMNFPH